MPMPIDHIGVATEDTAAAIDLHTGVFDATVVHEEEREDLAVTFLDTGSRGSDGAGYIELLEPLEGAEGAIPRFLERHGPGLHHLAIGTDDIEATLEAANDHGLEVLEEAPRPGAWGSRIAFVHPRSTGGVLLELVER